jgi:TonB family protein
MDPLDMVHFHSVIRPGAATIARTPEMRALDTRSFLFACSVHLTWMLVLALSFLLKGDPTPPPPMEVSIVVDGEAGPPSPPDVDQRPPAQPAALATQQMPAIGHSSIVAPGQATTVPSESKAAGNKGEQVAKTEAPKSVAEPLQPWELAPHPEPEQPKLPPSQDSDKIAKSTEAPPPDPASKATVKASVGGATSLGPPSDHTASPRSGGEGAILVAPIPFYRPQAPYPVEAQRNGWSGKVVLRVIVAANGRITGVAIAESSGYPALDTAAQKTMWTWRFTPGRQASGPINTAVNATIEFTLPN